MELDKVRIEKKYIDFSVKDNRRLFMPLGYRGFLSAMLALWKMNRAARSLDVRAKFEIVVPLRWFR